MNASTYAHLARMQAQSGLSIAAFCRKRGVALSTFHYWRKRAAAHTAKDDFVEVRLGQSVEQNPLATAGTPIHLTFRGATLILADTVSEKSLRRVLVALRESLPC